jgi:hypothetical protein
VIEALPVQRKSIITNAEDSPASIPAFRRIGGFSALGRIIFSVACGRQTILALKCPIERSFRLIPSLNRNLGNAAARSN